MKPLLDDSVAVISVNITTMNIIWFNGPSQLDLRDRVPPQTHEIGCNHIYLHRPVQHVVCHDWQMMDSIPTGPYARWIRSGHKRSGWQEVPFPLTQQPHNSGVLAIHLAIHLKWTEAHIIGCDWGVSNSSVFDYGLRNSERKYTNSQRRVISWARRYIALTSVNDNATDLPVDHVSVGSFLDSLVR